jgi:hypothetical protein
MSSGCYSLFLLLLLLVLLLLASFLGGLFLEMVVNEGLSVILYYVKSNHAAESMTIKSLSVAMQLMCFDSKMVAVPCLLIFS